MNQRSSITGYACLSRNGHAAILFRRTTAGDDVMPRPSSAPAPSRPGSQRCLRRPGGMFYQVWGIWIYVIYYLINLRLTYHTFYILSNRAPCHHVNQLSMQQSQRHSNSHSMQQSQRHSNSQSMLQSQRHSDSQSMQRSNSHSVTATVNPCNSHSVNSSFNQFLYICP